MVSKLQHSVSLQSVIVLRPHTLVTPIRETGDGTASALLSSLLVIRLAASTTISTTHVARVEPTNSMRGVMCAPVPVATYRYLQTAVQLPVQISTSQTKARLPCGVQYLEFMWSFSVSETTRVPGKFTVAASSIIAAFIAATPCCGFEHCAKHGPQR
jgi:hypothetical protein